MNYYKLVAAIVWFFVLMVSMFQGTAIPSFAIINSFKVGEVILIIGFPFIFFLFAAFFQRKGSGLQMVGSALERMFKPLSVVYMLRCLRPTLLFMCAVIVIGISGIITTFTTTNSFPAYILSCYFLSGGLGLLSAYLLSIKYPPRLI